MRKLAGKSLRFLASHIGWGLGLALIGYLIYRNPYFLNQASMALPAKTVFLMALFTCLANLCQGIRFWFLWPDGRIPFWKAACMPFCVHSANILLPFRGGETVLPLFIRKWDPSQKLPSLFYWVLVDKLVEFYAMMPLLAATAYFFHHHFKATLVLWAVSTVLFVAYWKRAKNPPRNLAMAFLCGLAAWAMNVMVFVPLVESWPVSMGQVVGTSLGGAIPGLPASVGTYEYAFVWVCEKAGMTGSTILLWALASHSVSIIITLILGAMLGAAWGWPSKMDQVEAKAKQMPLKHQVSNVIVYACGAVTLLSSGIFWNEQAETPGKRRKSP